MLHWFVTFLIVAIVSAIFGFSGLTPQASDTAQAGFIIFTALAFITLVAHITRVSR